MAIATLALCYNNKDVFRGVVKIRKGEAVQLIMESTDMENFKRIMTYYSKSVSRSCVCVCVGKCLDVL